MAETAAYLVDNILPRVPVRQWVLSFPIPLRGLFAVHPELLTPDGIHAAAGRTGAESKAAPDPLSRGAGAECEAAITDGAGASAASAHGSGRGGLPACARQARAPALGAVAQVRVRHRRGALRMRLQDKARGGDRRTGGHRENTQTHRT